VPGSAVAFDGVRDPILFDAFQFLFYGLAYELGDAAIPAAADQTLHAIELRALGIDDRFPLG
jgi:hypothetical protein